MYSFIVVVQYKSLCSAVIPSEDVSKAGGFVGGDVPGVGCRTDKANNQRLSQHL